MSHEMQTIKDGLRAAREAAVGAPVPTLEQGRAGFDARFGGLPPVNGATYAAVDAGGAPGEWVTPEAPTAEGTILYFHGGAFCVGSLTSHRRLVTSLSVAAGVRALHVDYRLAPEHPFPAGLDDAVAAYRWLIGPGGERPERVVIAGDSAGGGLALSTLLALRDAGDPLPAAAYVMSPWSDLTCESESMTGRAAVDWVLMPDFLRARARFYLPEGELGQPLVSPLGAELGGLPPMLIQVGEDEVLYDDAFVLAQRAQAAGVEVEYQEWPEGFHVFQLMVGVLPEADDATAKAGAWIAGRLAAREPGR